MILVLTTVKPLLPPEENADGTAGTGKASKRRVPKVKPLSLRLDAVRHTEADLDAICCVIRSHPGEIPVELRVRSQCGHEALLSVAEEFRVDPNEQLRKGLGLWLA
jgi:hypothetical protein